MKSLAAAAFATALTLAPSWAADQLYADSANKFEVMLPDQWTTEKPDDPDTKLVMNSPRKDTTGANCRVLAGADPASATSRQADIDKMLKSEVTEAFWKNIFAGDDAKSSTLEKWGTEERAGLTIHYAVGRLTVAAPDKSLVEVKAKQILVWVPGRFNWLNCSARADGWSAEEPSFETMFGSFRPT